MDPLKENSGGKSYALSGKIMLSAIIILFTVVILIVCLHIYARWFLLRSITRRQSNRSRRRRIRRTRIIFAVDPSDSFLVASTRGLDYSVLKSLPTFVYSSSAAATTGHGGELQECAVCLSEFEEGEEGRLLPKCNHSFHTACIDMWFHSHSTCPLCRTLVTPQIPALPSLPSPPTSSEIPVEFAVNVAEPETRPSSDLCPSCEHYENERPSSSSSASLPSPRPSSASSSAVTISIQVPRRNYFRSLEEEQFNLGSPRIQGLKSPLKSPGGRIQSLKRMFSRDWIGSVSPSSAAGMSYNSNAEIDLENGDEHQISPQSKR